jgi:hypothetical protein
VSIGPGKIKNKKNSMHLKLPKVTADVKMLQISLSISTMLHAVNLKALAISWNFCVAWYGIL